MPRHLLFTLKVTMRPISPAIGAIAIYIKGMKIYPYRFDLAPVKLRLYCPTAVMHSVKGTWVIRAVQCTVFLSQGTLWFASWKKESMLLLFYQLEKMLPKSSRFQQSFPGLAFTSVWKWVLIRNHLYELVPPRGPFSCKSNYLFIWKVLSEDPFWNRGTRKSFFSLCCEKLPLLWINLFYTELYDRTEYQDFRMHDGRHGKNKTKTDTIADITLPRFWFPISWASALERKFMRSST